MTSEPSALDREWVARLNDRMSTKSKTPAGKESRGSTINCQSYTYHDCIFIIQPRARSSTGSALFWGLFLLGVLIRLLL